MMEGPKVQENFQLIDNYVSEFSLNIFNKIKNGEKLDININIGFKIVNIIEKDMIGQIELKYDVSIISNQKEIGKIKIVMNALFKGSDNVDRERFEQMLKIDGATTLSHLCNAYIHSATALGGMPTIKMPLVNFHEFFAKAKQQKGSNPVNLSEQAKNNNS